MDFGKALGGGVLGACALTLLHETARKLIPHAPRMDVIGKRAIVRPLEAAGVTPPCGRPLYAASLAGEVVSNGLYYSLLGFAGRKHAVKAGGLLGLMGGLGAIVLPQVVGLGRQPGRRTPWTELMTIAWYTVGGLAAGAAAKALSGGE